VASKFAVPDLDVTKIFVKTKISSHHVPYRREGQCGLKSDDVLLILMLTSVVTGVALGVGLRAAKSSYSERESGYVSFLGDIFLRMLRCLTLPLMVSSIICSLTRVHLRTAGRLLAVTLTFFFATTLLAAVEGSFCVGRLKLAVYFKCVTISQVSWSPN